MWESLRERGGRAHTVEESWRLRGNVKERNEGRPPGSEGEDASSRPDLSLVIPLYNEAENVYPLHAALTHSLQELGWSYEVLYVDDGSSDGTYPYLLDLYRRDPHVSVIRLGKNFGQTPAMAAGFDRARGRILVTMDGDLQNDPADIGRLVRKLEQGYDVVCGWRRRRKDALFLRLFPSKAANFLISWITGVEIHDTGCTLKAYRDWVVRNMSLYSEMHRFIPALAAGIGARVTEIGVRHHRRRYGVSKYGIMRVFRVVLDLLVVKMIVAFAAHPIRWFALLSLPFFLLGGAFFFLGLVFFSFQGKGTYPVLLDRWDLGYMTSALLLAMTASNLFLLGFLSELAVKASGFFRWKAWEVEGAR